MQDTMKTASKFSEIATRTEHSVVFQPNVGESGGHKQVRRILDRFDPEENVED